MISWVQYTSNNNKTLALNISGCYILETQLGKVLKLMEGSDYVFCNEYEADLFAEKTGIKAENRREIAKAMSERGKSETYKRRTVIITQGPQPVIVA